MIYDGSAHREPREAPDKARCSDAQHGAAPARRTLKHDLLAKDGVIAI